MTRTLTERFNGSFKYILSIATVLIAAGAFWLGATTTAYKDAAAMAEKYVPRDQYERDQDRLQKTLDEVVTELKGVNKQLAVLNYRQENPQR